MTSPRRTAGENFAELVALPRQSRQAQLLFRRHRDRAHLPAAVTRRSGIEMTHGPSRIGPPIPSDDRKSLRSRASRLVSVHRDNRVRAIATLAPTRSVYPVCHGSRGDCRFDVDLGPRARACRPRPCWRSSTRDRKACITPDEGGAEKTRRAARPPCGPGTASPSDQKGRRDVTSRSNYIYRLFGFCSSPIDSCRPRPASTYRWMPRPRQAAFSASERFTDGRFTRIICVRRYA